MPAFIDLTGKKFGKWTVLELGEPTYTISGHKRTMWKCQCECGKVRDVWAASLREGKSCSCGTCRPNLKKLKANEPKVKEKRRNPCEEHGAYMVLFTLKNEPFYIDTEDYDKIKDYFWHIRPDDGYVGTHFKIRENGKIKQKSKLLHRLIMGEPDALVDHVHDDRKWDNRKYNLRIATRGENAINSAPRKKNISGCTGVTKTRSGTWRARIQVNGKEKWLGTFADLDDAIEARKKAEKEYYGDFSYDRSQEIAKQGLAQYQTETDDGFGNNPMEVQTT